MIVTTSLEVAESDLGEMTWGEAKEACAKLGEGWRLPTMDELDWLWRNKDRIGNFADAWYWSSFQSNYGSAWCQDFSDGQQNTYSKYSQYRVRAVREVAI